VETTTGPLGQGFGNAVGMAIAEAHLAAEFNQPEIQVIDHYVYAIVTDGDLMEGVASEAASLAGHLRLGKLIFLYDDNYISIDGSTDIAFTEDRCLRFEAYGWHVQKVEDGNSVEAIDAALRIAKEEPRPSLIACRTHIGYGLPTRQDTAQAHGEPPGDKELDGAKEKLGWPREPRFFIPEDTLAHWREALEKGAQLEIEWNAKMAQYRTAYPEQAAELDRRLKGELPQGWDESLPPFAIDPKGVATRIASGKVINQLAVKLPELMGGSADLAPSNKTWIEGSPAFQAATPSGRNFHFGVREHGMGAVVNGMALHGGVIPYAATFLVFSDYCRPAIRIAALSHIPSIWVFTHDSIGVGEDGPTHQPVEHFAALRTIPNLLFLRPADANETLEAWKLAIERREGPTALALSRQNLPVFDRNLFAPASDLRRGAYVLAEMGEGAPELILMASGSEVELIVEAGRRLAAESVNVRLVSFPSWELFKAQSREYRDTVLPPTVTARVAVEAGVAQGWERWVGEKGIVISQDRFGASAPYKVVYEKFGFTVENIIVKAQEVLRSRSIYDT
jgi:transketolase